MNISWLVASTWVSFDLKASLICLISMFASAAVFSPFGSNTEQAFSRQNIEKSCTKVLPSLCNFSLSFNHPNAVGYDTYGSVSHAIEVGE
jgi:hypothetical protein